MPLLVRLIAPARKALLLLGSSQEPVPGAKLSYNSIAYSSAATVSLELIATRLCSSASLASNPHSTQWVQSFASPVACPRANPGGVPLALSALHSFRHPGK